MITHARVCAFPPLAVFYYTSLHGFQQKKKITFYLKSAMVTTKLNTLAFPPIKTQILQQHIIFNLMNLGVFKFPLIPILTNYC